MVFDSYIGFAKRTLSDNQMSGVCEADVNMYIRITADVKINCFASSVERDCQVASG